MIGGALGLAYGYDPDAPDLIDAIGAVGSTPSTTGSTPTPDRSGGSTLGIDASPGPGPDGGDSGEGGDGDLNVVQPVTQQPDTVPGDDDDTDGEDEDYPGQNLGPSGAQEYTPPAAQTAGTDFLIQAQQDIDKIRNRRITRLGSY